MQQKRSCIHCNATGTQQKNVTEEGVEYRRQEHAKMLEGKTMDDEAELDYESLFGFTYVLCPSLPIIIPNAVPLPPPFVGGNNAGKSFVPCMEACG